MKNLKLINRGKVRDIYEITNIPNHLLMVTTDRVSAFDVILPNTLVGKGKILNEISIFWFKHMENLVPNHLSNEVTLEEIIPDKTEREWFKGRSMIVHKLNPLPVEAIVRGYVVGSGWKDYKKTGKICGIQLKEGLQEAESIGEPIYTPSTKAEIGDHDENISFEKTSELLGLDLATKVKEISIEMYRKASALAINKGIIIADTKFEFGTDDSGNLFLIDEVLTPDSSRFWHVNEYKIGISPPSYDKQIIRDWLKTHDWNPNNPSKLPDYIIERTMERYNNIKQILIES